jgi:hypothetical protein
MVQLVRNILACTERFFDVFVFDKFNLSESDGFSYNERESLH